MKKIAGILIFFLIAGFAGCMVLGFAGSIPQDVPEKSVSFYKFLVSLGYFLHYLPAIVFTGFIVSFSVHFGNNCEGSAYRFSPAMMERFKTIFISALVCAFVLTLTNEVFGNLIFAKKNQIINEPKLIDQYIKVSENFFNSGEYEKSYLYANAALKLEPSNKKAAALIDSAEEEITRESTSNIKFELYQKNSKMQEDTGHYDINTQKISDAYKCYLKAKEYYEKGEWINAHYYAQQGLKLNTPKDPNSAELKELSTLAWNKITEERKLEKNKDQEFFEKKYKGYLALVENDDLNAYYIFRDLYLTSRDYSVDPDVVFYLDVAQKRISERCFFDDEVLQLKSFEDINDVCFAYKYRDGSKDIVYFKGMTSVKETGLSIQYLRDVTIMSLSADNQLYRTMTVPYAKLLPVNIKNISPELKEAMGIDGNIGIIPYLMLNSVGRDNPDIKTLPLYKYAEGETTNVPEYMLLPMEYSDLTMLETQTSVPEKIPFGTLMRLMKKAATYGYSSEVFCETLLNRMLYPFWIVILLLGFASFAWNYRMGVNQYFKMSWIFCFPFVIFINQILYKWLIYIFKLLNLVLVGTAGIGGALFAGFVFYTIIMFLTALYFLGRRSAN